MTIKILKISRTQKAPTSTGRCLSYPSFLIVVIRDAFPAFFHIMCSELRPAVPSEDALPVPLDPHRALACFKVCEIPYMLADEVFSLIEYFMVRFQVEFLVLLRKHHRVDCMQSGDG